MAMPPAYCPGGSDPANAVIASEAKQSRGDIAPMHVGDCFASLAMTVGRRATNVGVRTPALSTWSERKRRREKQHT
jgi:hypothetical protein